MPTIFTKRYPSDSRKPKRSSGGFAYLKTFFSKRSKTTNTPSSTKNNRPKKPFPWKKLLFWLSGLMFAGILLLFSIFLYFTKDLPEPGQVNNRNIPESTKIYDRTGSHLLYEIHGEEKRTLIPFSEMPASIKYATLVLEDQDFYHHWGIKIDSIIRAALDNFIAFDTTGRGASTITQQLIKNSLLSSEKTYTRKIKEAILSLEIERKFSKDEILGMYLNEIPYGSNAYGIEAAAQTFFAKNAKDLTIDESALLAALPQAPSYLSPFGSHTNELVSRQRWAITKMKDLGYISEADAQVALEINTLEKLDPRIGNISAPHFVIYVKEYLEERYGKDTLEEGGLSVITTLDWNKQQLAERVVREQAEKNLASWNAENAALVAIDPKTAQILAMVGSKDFFSKDIDGQVNVAVRDRQPGSSIKPFVYLAAFTKGYTPETMLFDVPTDFETGSGEKYSPKNYSGTFIGPITMKEALARSLNIPAVKTLYLAGLNDSVSLAKNLGITTLNQPSRYGLSLVLGGGEVKLLDHTHAYATIANSGLYRKKTAILRITASNGDVLEEFHSSDGKRIVEEEYITMLDHALSTNEYRAPVFGENNPLRFDNTSVAAKTGTTNDYRDGWTMGYTPLIAVGVWVGNNDNREMRAGADGSIVAAPIWRAFMQEVLQNINNEPFPEYDKEKFKRDKDMLDGKLEIEEDVKVCEVPGKNDTYCKANRYCVGDNKEEKKDFANVHTILHFVTREDPLGNTPERPENDPQYRQWEKGVREYYKDEKYIFDAPPQDECREDDFSKYKPSISLNIPKSSKQTFTIQANIDAPYGTDSVEYFINGVSISKSKDSSISYTASESQNGETLSVRVIITDKNGNTANAEGSVSVSWEEPLPNTPLP
jgi:1A family penicillin-binding protein